MALVTAPQRPQTIGWRARVRDWLQLVYNQSWTYGDILTSARHNGDTFPKSWAVFAIRELFHSLAVWIVKSALRQAAADLNLGIDDVALGVLADLVVTFL